MIFLQEAYICHLIISRSNMSVYNNRNYCNVQKESLINVNLFLPDNDYLLTKLNAEKDIASQRV